MNTVNCRDFERLWNEQLDARDDAAPALRVALEVHASACPECGPIARRYDALRRALGAWGPGPMSDGDATEIILTAYAALPTGRAVRPVGWPSAAWWSAVAATVAALVVGVVAARRADQPEPPSLDHVVMNRPGPAEPAPRPLAVALAEATAATIDLALETSGPAARFGRVVIASATTPEPERPEPPASIEPLSSLLPDVGDGLSQGVRPLSGTARHAFRFLLPSGLDGSVSRDEVDRGA